MKTMGERLRQARISAGYKSAISAAQANGWGVSTFIAHENGQNEFNAEKAEMYGKAFKTSPEWLLFGRTQAGSDIDRQLSELPPEQARALIEKFNSMIEGVRLVGKIR